jgi:hypothetical protein
VIVRKNLIVKDPKQGRLFPDYRYFLYITNDWESMAEEIVFSANDRCQQENLLAQLNALRALHAPVDNLLSNEAYMQMTALAWNLKAWLALSLPEPAVAKKPTKKAKKKQGKRCKSLKQEKKCQPSEKQRLLRLEFRTFVNYFLRIPAQVISTGRQTVVRLLATNKWQSVFFRLATKFTRPSRC